MREWGCTGIIGRLYTPELVEVARNARVPQVLVEPDAAFLRPGAPPVRHSIVRCDTAAVGELATDYFLGRKFKHYTYVGEVRNLDDLMRGITRKRKIITYGPAHVVSRRSTETMQIADIVVIQALEFIALNACAGIGVPDVVRHTRASRRLAEQRFRQALGHTILDEILRVRLTRVCTLLKETNLPISRITHMCGFESESHLGVVFRKRHACTMRDYRKNR